MAQRHLLLLLWIGLGLELLVLALLLLLELLAFLFLLGVKLLLLLLELLVGIHVAGAGESRPLRRMNLARVSGRARTAGGSVSFRCTCVARRDCSGASLRRCVISSDRLRLHDTAAAELSGPGRSGNGRLA